MGHQHYSTTQRYLHHKPRREDAARLAERSAGPGHQSGHQTERKSSTTQSKNAVPEQRLSEPSATPRRACKAVYTGSIPVGASGSRAVCGGCSASGVSTRVPPRTLALVGGAASSRKTAPLIHARTLNAALGSEVGHLGPGKAGCSDENDPSCRPRSVHRTHTQARLTLGRWLPRAQPSYGCDSSSTPPPKRFSAPSGAPRYLFPAHHPSSLGHHVWNELLPQMSGLSLTAGPARRS